MRAIIFAALAVSTVCGQTTVRFSKDSGDAATAAFAVGPFPANVLTTPDPTQLTGLHVNLPASEGSCLPESSPVCSNNNLLNKIDGFSVNPRVMACFSGPVDPATLSQAVSIVPVSGPGAHQHPSVPASIGQIILDPATNCAFAKPDRVLDQRTSYLLVITDLVKDTAGNRVQPDPAYTDCVTQEPDTYCDQLSDALQHSRPIPKGRVVAASLFTTMTVTNWLERAHAFVDATPQIALPAGFPWLFPTSTIQKITWTPAQSGLPSQDISLDAITDVDSIAFGLFLSPNYLNPSAAVPGTIDGSPTAPNAYAPVSFHVFLPPGPGKGAKIPVVIYGHGLGDSQFGAPTYIASTFAKKGFATLAFEVPGHGFGSGSQVKVTTKNGTFTELTPGRGIQLMPPNPIGPTDGCIIPGPFGIRDCARQTAVDLFTLVKAIQTTNGLGLNLDPKRIYYVGQSLGSIVGTLFMAVEPAVRTAVLNGAGGTEADIARFAISGRLLGLGYLQSIGDPLLFNVAAGLAPPEPYFHDAFNDNYVFRGKSPLVNDVPGAMADQAAFEAADWIGMVGDPLAFAPHLKSSLLAGVPAKSVLFQFGVGDLEVPNPAESAIVRAADAQSSTSLFDFPSAVWQVPTLAGIHDPAFGPLPILPHRLLSNPTIVTAGNEAEKSLAVAEQRQTADYFSSNGTRITDPDTYLTAPFGPGSNLFRNAPPSLPDELNFIQFQP